MAAIPKEAMLYHIGTIWLMVGNIDCNPYISIKVLIFHGRSTIVGMRLDPNCTVLPVQPFKTPVHP